MTNEHLVTIGIAGRGLFPLFDPLAGGMETEKQRE
jgi:hypothetical protein